MKLIKNKKSAKISIILDLTVIVKNIAIIAITIPIINSVRECKNIIRNSFFFFMILFITHFII